MYKIKNSALTSMDDLFVFDLLELYSGKPMSADGPLNFVCCAKYMSSIWTVFLYALSGINNTFTVIPNILSSPLPPPSPPSSNVRQLNTRLSSILIILLTF